MKQLLEAPHLEVYETIMPFGEDLIVATSGLHKILQGDLINTYFQVDGSGNTIIETSQEESEPELGMADYIRKTFIPFGGDCMLDVSNSRDPIQGRSYTRHSAKCIIDGKEVVDETWSETDEDDG